MKLIHSAGPVLLAAAAMVAVPQSLGAHFKLVEPAGR